MTAAVPGIDRAGFRPERPRPPGRIPDVHQLMWWLYLVAVIVGTGALVAQNAVEALFAPQALVIGLVFASGLAALLLWIVSRLDVAGAPPAGAYVAAFGWGALVAPALAVVANDNMLAVYQRAGLGDWAAALAAPTDEETAKLLGVVVVLYLVRRTRPRPIDGLILGAVCGIGFEVVENVQYAIQTALADPNSDVVAALRTGLARILVGFGGHAIFTACAGLGIAYALGRTGIAVGRRFGTAIGMFAVAWSLHGLWDSPETFGLQGAAQILVFPLKYVVLVVAFVLAYRSAARTEYTWLGEALDGAPAEVVAPSDLADLGSRHARHAARRRARQAGGHGAERALKDLQHAQLALANLVRDTPIGSPVVARQELATAQLRARAVELGAVPPAGTDPRA